MGSAECFHPPVAAKQESAHLSLHTQLCLCLIEGGMGCLIPALTGACRASSQRAERDVDVMHMDHMMGMKPYEIKMIQGGKGC